MWLKSNVLIFALVVCWSRGQEQDDDSELWGAPKSPEEITAAPPPSTSVKHEECIVRGEKGFCVESRLYCKTVHTGEDTVTWRSAGLSCRDDRVCCKESDIDEGSPKPNPDPDASTTSGCGIRNKFGAIPKGANDIVQAKFGEFPWTVAVFEVDKNGKEKYSCVGSLIHPQVVLTGANRFDRGGTFKVRAGDWHLPSEQEPLERQDRTVLRTILHEEYNNGFGRNDIALLILDSEIKADTHINFVCLPNAGQVTAAASECFATGWGKPTEDGDLQDTQKMVSLQVIEHGSCQEKLRKRNKKYTLHSSMMCATGVGQDTCRGDGGAPLVCPYEGQDTRYYQAGITSWGYKCNSPDFAGVYSDVANLRPWIDRKMRENSFSTSYYTPA